MLQNTIADLEQNRMPLKGYVAQHPEARLSKQEIQDLIAYFQKIYEQEGF